MKKKIMFVALSFLLLVIIFSCSDNATDPTNDISVKPTVKITSTDYDEQLFNNSFPENDILNEISDAYRSSYSNDIKIKLIDYVSQKVESLGENKNTFKECFELSGCKEGNSISLPTYIKKANYNGVDAWIIQLTWGVDSSDLGHYKCFAIGINSKDTLYYSRCK